MTPNGSLNERRSGEDVASTPPAQAEFLRRSSARPPDPPVGTGGSTFAAHAVYALYALAFVTGITAVVGVVVAYASRKDAENGWLGSHLTWQIRTFWWGVLLQAIGWVTLLILIGWVLLPLATLWFVWRIAKGWIRLANGQPVENPTSFF